MLSFHVKFVQTDRQTVKQYALDFMIQRHKNMGKVLFIPSSQRIQSPPSEAQQYKIV